MIGETRTKHTFTRFTADVTTMATGSGSGFTGDADRLTATGGVGMATGVAGCKSYSSEIWKRTMNRRRPRHARTCSDGPVDGVAMVSGVAGLDVVRGGADNAMAAGAVAGDELVGPRLVWRTGGRAPTAAGAYTADWSRHVALGTLAGATHHRRPWQGTAGAPLQALSQCSACPQCPLLPINQAPCTSPARDHSA